jgi:hypothetical protein
LFVAKFRQKCRRLGGHLHRQLCLSFDFDLNLDLNLDFYPSLFDALLKQVFETLFLQLFKKLFGSLFNAIHAALAFDFHLLTYDFFYGQMLPPRRPVGRGVGGRIVVANASTTTYRQDTLGLPSQPGVQKSDPTRSRKLLKTRPVVPGSIVG